MLLVPPKVVVVTGEVPRPTCASPFRGYTPVQAQSSRDLRPLGWTDAGDDVNLELEPREIDALDQLSQTQLTLRIKLQTTITMSSAVKKKLVVCGGNGFLGSRICKAAVARDWDVTSIR